MADIIHQYCQAVSYNFQQLVTISDDILAAYHAIQKSLQSGGKIIFCGNGGSAADAQHLAAEFVGRYKKERAAIAAIALTVDTSAMTAIANDYHFDDIFSRQLSALGHDNDILYAISTSGKSMNIINAIAIAKEKNITTIGVTGASGGKMCDICDMMICVPSDETNHIQEMHIAVGHMLCGMLEDTIK